MKPAKIRTMSVSSSHQTKSNRRNNLPFSNVHISLRFTSIFIIAIAFCEFSGLTETMVHAYTSASIHMDTSQWHSRAKNSPMYSESTRQTAASAPFVRVLDNKQSNHYTKNKPKLRSLYHGVQPDTRLEKYVKFLDKQRKPRSKLKPNYLLEMHWSGQNPNEKVCRIHNACIQRNGTLLLHPWIKSQETHLQACGIYKFSYMSSPQVYEKHTNRLSMDLFGIRPTRFHIPHFLTDILPMLYASEILRPQINHSDIQGVCETPSRKRCDTKSVKEVLYPAVYVEDRVMSMKVSSWVPQLSAMLPGSPYVLSPKSIFANSSTACFRSIVAFEAYSYRREGREWYGNNKMFERHGLTRKSVLRETETKDKCKIHVTILNREGWKKRGNLYLGRDIVNVKEVVDKVTAASQVKENKNLDMSIEVAYFENKTFVEQVEVMQRADVVLGVHGAGLGNLVFARQDVPVVEVLPFTYYAGPFDMVSKALYLKHSRLIAEPDTENFLGCMEQRAKRANDGAAAAKARVLWMEAIRRKEKDGDINYLMTHKMRGDSLLDLRLCARAQRMALNADETANYLLTMAQDVCKGEA